LLLSPRPAALHPEASRRKMVAAFRPVPYYAPFPNSSTQPQVIRNKRLTTNLLDIFRLGYARLKSGTEVNRLLDPKSDNYAGQPATRGGDDSSAYWLFFLPPLLRWPSAAATPRWWSMWTSTTSIATTRMIIESRHHRRTTAATTRRLLEEATRAQQISKNEMAALPETSRAE